MSMRLVRCTSERKQMPGQLVVGKKYWIDESTTWKDFDGDEYAQVYLDEDKQQRVGDMLTSHFEDGFLLKDIISWGFKESFCDPLIYNLILYISNNYLNTEENMKKKFVVNYVPLKEFAERGMEKVYEKYMGYSLYCVD